MGHQWARSGSTGAPLGGSMASILLSHSPHGAWLRVDALVPSRDTLNGSRSEAGDIQPEWSRNHYGCSDSLRLKLSGSDLGSGCSSLALTLTNTVGKSAPNH